MVLRLDVFTSFVPALVLDHATEAVVLVLPLIFALTA